MKRLLAFCGLIVLAAAVPVHAGEWVYFKNGHKMLVESMREEDGIVYLKLSAGNEVGFPKNLLAEVTQTIEARSNGRQGAAPRGRGPGFNDLMGTQRVLSEMGTSQRNAKLESQRMRAGTNYSYGFSYKGSEDISRMQRATRTSGLRDQLRDMNALDTDSSPNVDAISDDSERSAGRASLGVLTRPNKRDIPD